MCAKVFFWYLNDLNSFLVNNRDSRKFAWGYLLLFLLNKLSIWLLVWFKCHNLNVTLLKCHIIFKKSQSIDYKFILIHNSTIIFLRYNTNYVWVFQICFLERRSIFFFIHQKGSSINDLTTGIWILWQYLNLITIRCDKVGGGIKDCINYVTSFMDNIWDHFYSWFMDPRD